MPKKSLEPLPRKKQKRKKPRRACPNPPNLAEYQPDAETLKFTGPNLLIHEDILSSGLSTGAKLLYTHLAHCAGLETSCSPSYVECTDALNVSRQSISNWLAELVESGLVDVEHRSHKGGRGRRSNRYHFNARRYWKLPTRRRR